MKVPIRRNGVNIRLVAIGVAVATIFGCTGGGGGGTTLGTVSGIVTDVSGGVVRNARVYYTGDQTKITYSNSSGAYVLDGLKEGIVRVRADLLIGGVAYLGENHIDVFGNERSKSLNIVVGRASDMGVLDGTVTDRSGVPLAGVRIYANGNNLGSLLGMSDDKGKFHIPGFFPGVNYEIYATGRGYNSDATTLSFTSHQTRTNNFVLSNGQDPLLPTPQNLFAVAWTSPRVNTTTGAPQRGNPKAALRASLDGRNPLRAVRTMRSITAKDSAGGNFIEVELGWDPVRSNSHIGYGIYRGTSAGGATKGIEFLRDPLTTLFADSDRDLAQDTNYYYEITAINTQYPNTDNSESNFSNRYGVRTLGDMTLRTVQTTPLRFNWNGANGATQYTVYVFADYPDYGVSPFWPRDGNDAEFNAATTTGTSLAYGGPALTAGRTYYYLVLGHANNFDSRTISVVSSFRAN